MSYFLVVATSGLVGFTSDLRNVSGSQGQVELSTEYVLLSDLRDKNKILEGYFFLVCPQIIILL